MVYTTTSIKPVIGRILRNTRITDMTYADDFIEWIGEGLNRMLIRWRLNPTNAVVKIKNHTGSLPCGLVTLNGVIYNGSRLRLGTGQNDVRVHSFAPAATIDSFFATKTTVPPTTIIPIIPISVNEQDYRLIRGLNLTQITTVNTIDYYQLQYNHIKTSFSDGVIIILYRQLDLDKEGYPLIPDLEEAREALFWYVCSRLCFTGYKLPESAMDFKFCNAEAEKFFRKAKDIIKIQSTDEKESQVQLLNNLIPPQNYYDTFFINGEQQKFVNK